MAWVLQTIHALDLQPHPAVAVMPLGTGNDLALSFGWGNAFQQAWIAVRPPPPSPPRTRARSIIGDNQTSSCSLKTVPLQLVPVSS